MIYSKHALQVHETPILCGMCCLVIGLYFFIICFLTFFFSNGEQKLLGILIAVGEAVACVLLGMYGNVSQLGAGNAILIIIQLCFAGIIVICLKTVEPQ